MGRSRKGLGTLWEVQDLSWDHPGGPRRVRGPSLEVQDRSGDLPGGPGPFLGRSQRSRTGRGTLGEIRDGSKVHRGGP